MKRATEWGVAIGVDSASGLSASVEPLPGLAKPPRTASRFPQVLSVLAKEDAEIDSSGPPLRGNDGPDSDIDVLVILSREDRQLRREIIRQAARLSLTYDVLPRPRVMGTDRWAEMQGFSFYQNVQRDATDLAP